MTLARLNFPDDSGYLINTQPPGILIFEIYIGMMNWLLGTTSFVNLFFRAFFSAFSFFSYHAAGIGLRFLSPLMGCTFGLFSPEFDTEIDLKFFIF